MSKDPVETLRHLRRALDTCENQRALNLINQTMNEIASTLNVAQRGAAAPYLSRWFKSDPMEALLTLLKGVDAELSRGREHYTVDCPDFKTAMQAERAINAMVDQNPDRITVTVRWPDGHIDHNVR